MATRRASGQGAQTRERLIQAAEQLMLEGGSEKAVSVRALEAHAGVTAPTIYRHFPDMNTLLAEVAMRAFSRFEAALGTTGTGDNPLVEVAALGRAVARFGLEHPNEYRVLTMNRVDDEPQAFAMVRTATGYRRLVDGIRLMIEQGMLPATEDPDEVASILVMALHGVISMLIARPGAWGDPEQLVERMMQTVGLGILPRPS